MASTADVLAILVLNQISESGLSRLPAERYRVGKDMADPGGHPGALGRPARLEIPPSVRAIARAGAGTNNIPVKPMSARGVPVFNAPGANANAVKELVLAGMLMAARNLAPALRFVEQLDPATARPRRAGRRRQEDLRRLRAGRPDAGRDRPGQDRLPGGRCGDQARHERARATTRRSRSMRPGACRRRCKRAGSVDEVLKTAHFVTLHVPLVDAHAPPGAATTNLALMRADAVLLNFSRDGVVDDAAVRAALDARKLGRYVCDFPQRRGPAPPARGRAAPPGCVHARGRGQLRRDGGRPAARLPGARQHRQRGQFPAGEHGARVGLPAGDRQRQRAQHGGPDLHRHGAAPA